MDNVLTVAGKTVGWVLFLSIIYLSYRFIWRDSLPNLTYAGWNTLQPTYAATRLPARWATTSVRVGSDLYQGTMRVAFDAQGMYLQRLLPGTDYTTMYLPYNQFRLVEAPKSRAKLLTLSTYGIFSVEGVDIWLDSPYADQLMVHLRP